MRGKTAIIIILLLLISISTSGCDLSWLSQIFAPDPCNDDPDSKHCYQGLAVDEQDPKHCDKIKAPEGYKTSNPPKDKCYMMVAEASDNVGLCSRMKGGEGSYTKEECVNNLATKNNDISACDVLRGEAAKKCKENIAGDLTTDDINKLEDSINELRTQVVNNPGNKDLQTELDKLRQQKTDSIENAPPEVQREYFRQEREKIFEEIEDADVRSDIAKDFTKFRNEHPDKTMEELIEQMDKIKEEKETIKRLDEEANKIIDDLKNNAIQYGTDKATGAIEDVGKKAWEWTFKEGSDNMKWQMSRLERMKDSYDKGSAQYNALKEKYDKIKKVYDEVNEVYGKVQKVNKLLADGKIDEGKAKVIKGAVYLGKGLEYATSYVPVFGSTISTVSKEMFDTTVKLATKRAQRTTSINKCIDDPLNCDTDGISAY